jgi:hypothetical protein
MWVVGADWNRFSCFQNCGKLVRGGVGATENPNAEVQLPRSLIRSESAINREQRIGRRLPNREISEKTWRRPIGRMKFSTCNREPTVHLWHVSKV